ncbi:unnamed protein product [Somion occarium]|uniref:Pentatricopeptide repeat-containing protein n=1 Tax=Somion occarium TaxID=3059160 RepID=A0ABP1CHY4_9APHY
MLRHAAQRVHSHITLDFLLPRSALRVRTIVTSFKSSYADPIPPKILNQVTDPAFVEALGRIPPLPAAVHTLSQPDAEWFNTTIANLREALQDKDISNTCRLWSSLSQKGFLGLLGPAHLEMCSRHLGAMCNSLPVGAADWNNANQQEIEEMAIHLALEGHPQSLRDYMIFHVKRKAPDVVHRVYAQYYSRLRERSESEYNEGNDDVGTVEEMVGDSGQPYDADHPSSTLLDIENRSLVMDNGDLRVPHEDAGLPLVPGDILFAEVAAYALQDRYHEALYAFLQTKTRMLRPNLSLGLARIGKNGVLRDKVETYFKRVNLARLLRKKTTIANQISNLTQSRADVSLMRLYDQIKSELSASDRWLTLDPAELDDKVMVVVPDFIWASFLTAFLRCRRLDLAEVLWDDMTQLGVKTDVAIWTALLTGYAELGPAMSDKVAAAWDIMVKQGVTPEPLTYRALIQGLFVGGQTTEALLRFKEFQDALKHLPNVEESTRLLLYNTVLHGLLFQSMEDDAYALLRRMQTEGPSPDIVTFNTFMRYHQRKGDLKKLASILQMIDSQGLVGDVFTFSTLLRSLLPGVKANTALYTGIIDHLLRQENITDFKAAMALLTKMEQSEDKEIAPNDITYTNLLARIVQARWLDATAAEDFQRDIMQRMRSRNIVPTKPMYHILLRASLSNPEPRGVRNALLYFRGMQADRLMIGHDAWYVLLQGLAQRKEWELANQLVSEMNGSGFVKTAALMKVVNKIKMRWRAQEASTGVQ